MSSGKPTANPSAGGSAAGKKTGSSHTIGMISLIAFAVGTMVGGGVFALSGIVVKDAGAGSIIAYIIAGLVMLLSAVSFAAVASRAKPGETGYAPVGRELSPMWRFITMWAFYIMGVTGVAFVLMSFGKYFLVFFPHDDAKIVALVAAVLLILLNYGPAALVGKAETAMVAFKVTVLIILILFGVKGFVPSAFEHWAPHGMSSILTATALLFTAYSGFNVITNMSGSVENPQKKVPRAIVLSLAIVAVIYVGVAVALVVSGTSGQSGFEDHALTMAAQKLMGHKGAVLVGIAALVSTLSGANANLLGAADLLVRMAENGSIPSKFGKLSKKGNPIAAVTMSGIIILALMLLGSVPGVGSGAMKLVVTFSNVSGIIAMVLVDVTAFKMALKKWPQPGMKLPLGWLIPGLAVVAALAQLPSLGWSKVAIGTAMVAVGFVIWAFRHHSDPQDVQNITDHVARFDTPLLRAVRSKHTATHAREAVHSVKSDAAPSSPATGTTGGSSAPAAPKPGGDQPGGDKSAS